MDNLNLVILLIILFLITIFIIKVIKALKFKEGEYNETSFIKEDLNEGEKFRDNKIVKVEKLTPTQFIDNSQLFEIKDKNVVAYISQTMPNAAEAIAKLLIIML